MLRHSTKSFPNFYSRKHSRAHAPTHVANLLSKCHNIIIMLYWSQPEWSFWIPSRMNVTFFWLLHRHITSLAGNKKPDSFDLCESPTEHKEARRSEILLLKRSLIKSEYNKVPFVCFIRCQIEMCSTARRKHVGLRLFIMFTLPYLQHALRWQLNTRVTRQKLITFSSGSNAIFPHCNSCESLQACERARERQAKGQLIPQLHLQGDLPITGCELVWPWKVSFRHQRAKWCVGL